MKSALLVALMALLAVSALAQFSFSGNVTVDDPDNSLTYRSVSMAKIGNDAYGFRSVSVNISRENGTFTADVDTIGGFISYNKIPAGLLSYFSGSLSFDPSSFDVASSKNLMAKAYYRLDEINAAGDVVYTYWLGGRRGGDDVDWDATANMTQRDLKWVTIDADFDVRGDSDANGEFKFQTTWFLSSVVGEIDYANTTITPRTLESVVRINNYPYAEPTNRLVLYLAAAYGNSSFTAIGDKISTGSALEQVYVQLAGNCQVAADVNAKHGQIKAVKMGSWTHDSSVRDIIDGSVLRSYLQAKFKSVWDVRTINITFPANASNIIYDPALSTGQSRVDSPSGNASATLPSIFLIAIAAFLGLFFY